MTYEVAKTFRDRLCNLKVRAAGEPYDPPTPERASELLAKGFVRTVGDQNPPVRVGEAVSVPATVPDAEILTEIRHVGGGFWQLPNGERVRGKDSAIQALRKLQGRGA